MEGQSSYWFRAKRFGWGVGPPCAWQGWATFVAYLLVMTFAPVVVGHGAADGVVIICATVSLIVVLAAKTAPKVRR